MRFIEWLVREAYITPEQAERHRRQPEREPYTGWFLVESGYMTGRALSRAMAEHFDLPLVDLEEATLDHDAARRIPRELAERAVAVPLRDGTGSNVLATGDPTKWAALEEIEFRLGAIPRRAVAPGYEVLAAIGRLYAPGGGALEE